MGQTNSHADLTPKSVIEKLLNLLARQGIGGTLKEANTRVQAYIQGPIRRYIDAKFDRQFGTDTSGIIPLNHLHVKEKDATHCIWYQPTPEQIIRKAIAHVDKDFSEATFIDFGSGKGRALLVASDYPFRKVLGVEFSPVLHGIAEENIRNYCGTTAGPARVRSVCINAVDFDIPSGPGVFFFFTPFKSTVLRNVLDRVKQHKGAATLIYYGLSPEVISMFDELGWVRDELPIERNLLDLREYRLLFYSNVSVR